jgi:hypothetical protein
MVEMLMDDKFERAWEDLVTQRLHVGTEESDEKPLRIAIVQTEIRTEHV